MLETHITFINVTVTTDWSSRVRWLTLAHEFEVRSAFDGAVIS